MMTEEPRGSSGASAFHRCLRVPPDRSDNSVSEEVALRCFRKEIAVRMTCIMPASSMYPGFGRAACHCFGGSTDIGCIRFPNPSEIPYYQNESSSSCRSDLSGGSAGRRGLWRGGCNSGHLPDDREQLHHRGSCGGVDRAGEKPSPVGDPGGELVSKDPPRWRSKGSQGSPSRVG